MHRLFLAIALGAVLACSTAAVAAVPPVWPPQLQTNDQLDWHHSRALGKPWKGTLVKGVNLPEQGQDFFTWDWGLQQSPNRKFRRWGTDTLVYTLLTVIHEYRVANPGSPRIGIADLSRTHGGSFGKRYGGLGHSSHQNGLDVDVLYPRRDGQERPPDRVSDINRPLAQDLVNRFAGAGTQYVFVGPRTRLRGPRQIVSKLVYHDDHMHIRVWPASVLARHG